VLDEELRSNLRERMKRRDASHKPRAIRLLQIHDGVHQTVGDLLARVDERSGDFLLALLFFVLAFLRLEDLLNGSDGIVWGKEEKCNYRPEKSMETFFLRRQLDVDDLFAFAADSVLEGKEGK
jgi:hypothetical protein